MSILIQGMEMPKDRRVKLLVFPNGYVGIYDVYGKYLANAQAISLPEKHGRLGDLDALYEVAKTMSMGIYGPCNYQCVITGNDILKAHAIIPAEGGNDNG